MTSQVRDPLLTPAGAMSMNTVKYGIRDKAIIDVGVDESSEVVYYSPAVSEDKLNLAVKLKFDGFDRNRVQEWIGAVGDVASLPSFIAGGALAGPVGSASGQAIVRAVEGGGRASRQRGRPSNRCESMVALEWDLNINRRTLLKAEAGWFLLYPKTKESSGRPAQWGSGYTSTQATSGSEVPFTVNGVDFTIGTMGRCAPRMNLIGPTAVIFPYAAVSVDGHAEFKTKLGALINHPGSGHQEGGPRFKRHHVVGRNLTDERGGSLIRRLSTFDRPQGGKTGRK